MFARRSLLLTALLLVGGLLGACAKGPAMREIEAALPEPPGRQGRIFFYRQAIPFLVGVEPGIIVNGRQVGVARMGTVFFRNAKPGRYEVFLTGDEENRLHFTLGPGETYFVKAALALTLTGYRLRVEEVAPEQGEQEIESLTAVEGTVAE